MSKPTSKSTTIPISEEQISGLPTKSEKIRALFRAGMSKADIGRYLEISYQHVYNASVAIGAAPPLARSKNLRRTCDQQWASRTSRLRPARVL